MPLFLVSLKNTEQNRKIAALKYIFRTPLKIENYVMPLAPRQCYKCQGFKHVAKNCHLNKVYCVKCAGEYETKECTKKKEAPARFINCKVNHTASYKGFPVYSREIKNVAKIKKAEIQKENPNFHIENNKDFPRLRKKSSFHSFAQAAKSTPTKNRQQHRQTHHTDNRLPADKESSLIELVQLSNGLLNDYFKGSLTRMQVLLRQLEINSKFMDLIVA